MSDLYDILNLPKELVKIIASFYYPILVQPFCEDDYNCYNNKTRIEDIVLTNDQKQKIKELRLETSRLMDRIVTIQCDIEEMVKSTIKKREEAMVLQNKQLDIVHDRIYPSEDNIADIEKKIPFYADACVESPIIFTLKSNVPYEKMELYCQNTLEDNLSNYAFRIKEYTQW